MSALEGIQLELLQIETSGDIDLRGFLGIDPTVSPGYDSLSYTVTIKGDVSELREHLLGGFAQSHVDRRLMPNRSGHAGAPRAAV